MKQQGEASVEEILDSIKRVIARDNRQGAVIERKRRNDVGVVSEDGGSEEDEVFDLAEAELIEDDYKRDLEDDSEVVEEDDTPLITSKVGSSMQENFAALAMLSEPSAKPQIVRSGETSLEGMVREMLRPMLAEWIDKNLPGMVEKLVKDEIARIARKRS